MADTLGCPKIWGTILGPPRIRNIVIWGLHWGPPLFWEITTFGKFCSSVQFWHWDPWAARCVRSGTEKVHKHKQFGSGPIS